MNLLSRTEVLARLKAAYADPDVMDSLLQNTEFPPELRRWLGHLRILYGVPIQYLVPNDRMLPPESIRFFYVDNNWIDALLDGALSIGRNLSADDGSVSISVDRIVSPSIKAQAESATAKLRSDSLGLAAPSMTFGVITGFLLRSSLVANYPGLGVNVYPYGSTPKDPNPTPLDIIRMELLGPCSDTLICFAAGDIYQADIHEAPEGLHYGIDEFDTTAATKNIHLFTKSGSTVTMSDTLVTLDLLGQSCIRSQTNGTQTTPTRTLKMSTLASLIASSQQPALSGIDSSEMGFEMTEGVGMVSFLKSIS